MLTLFLVAIRVRNGPTSEIMRLIHGHDHRASLAAASLARAWST